jgi:putative hemolysin
MREIPWLYRLFFPRRVSEVVQAAVRDHPDPPFSAGLLRRWGIDYALEGEERIPRHGAAIVVANHSTGLLEGILLAAVLPALRADARILANSLLRAFPPLEEVTIAVNPFGVAASQNTSPLRQALERLRKGGMLGIFPAGEVAYRTWRRWDVTEPRWNSLPARLAMTVGCPVIPVNFPGRNSEFFYATGLVHPRLRTCLIVRELERKAGARIRGSVGEPIPASQLRQFADPDTASAFLRDATLRLNRTAGSPPAASLAADRTRETAEV